jgi:hypothetical protein
MRVIFKLGCKALNRTCETIEIHSLISRYDIACQIRSIIHLDLGIFLSWENKT